MSTFYAPHIRNQDLQDEINRDLQVIRVLEDTTTLLANERERTAADYIEQLQQTPLTREEIRQLHIRLGARARSRQPGFGMTPDDLRTVVTWIRDYRRARA